ncbi:MAG TPA: polysaccharide biosynthesis tyrosine autokinase [Pirellulaceae bacterium]|nr:polysaccharide biosynthesis tyrosine autokinase [Pirellulaceae bacterium]
MNMHTHPSPVPGSPPAAPTDPKLILQIVLITLRCWWKIAVPVGIVLAAIAVAAVIRLVDPTYTATAWVLIRERPDYLVSQNAFTLNQQKQIQNQLELMRSPLLLNAVLQVKGVADAPELIDQDDPVGALRKRLRVKSQNQSDYFVIEFTSTSARHASLIVNAVADNFLLEQSKINSGHVGGMIKTLNEMIDKQKNAVGDLERSFRSLAISEGVNPLGPNSEDTKVQARNMIIELKALQLNAERQAQGLASQIAAEQGVLDGNKFAPLESDVERRVEQHPPVVKELTAVERLKSLLADYQRTSTNAQVIAAKKAELVKAEQHLKDVVMPEIRDEIRKRLVEEAQRVQKERIAELHRQLEQIRLDVSLFKQDIANLEKDQAISQGETIDLTIAQNAFQRGLDHFERMKDRKQSLEIEQQAPATAQLFQVADVPAAPDSELPFKHMGLAGSAAFLLPFGLAVGLEYLRRRVSNREQLEQGGHISVLGEVTALPRRRRSTKDGHSHRDLQLFEESIDGLRTFLTLRESMLGMKVIAVSSAISREGKTSIAAQLAVSLASATGERTLLIDGDMRSPDVDKIFGVERGPGLADVLQGDVPIEEAIETDFNDTLHLLTAGNLTCSPHRLLGNGEFSALLGQLRASYHYIVVDTPPLLPASEALVMARAADAAILCVRRDFSRLDQVVEARDRLRQSGVKTAGAVLSGIPPRIYERRYGSYYYKNKVGA